MTGDEPIAIIGIGLRFPGAGCVGSFWEALCAGHCAIRDIPDQRWDMRDLYDPERDRPGRICQRRAGLVEEVEAFDWRAFRLAPREARKMDPQHRLLLEVAWEALEDAGLPPDAVRGSRTGVFVGVNTNDYQRLLAHDWDELDGYALLGTTTAFAANRISYAFDLKGRSGAVSYGCASSTVAVHDACLSLRAGEVEMALAGGVELLLGPDTSIMLSRAGVLSPSGRCRALDASADGYVRGEGAGLLVLKPLSKVAPHERVYALVRGGAVSHNGRNEWIMAASTDAQETVLRWACHNAGVDPATLEYVELHGSALHKGDAIEIAALGKALDGPARRLPCRVGAVSNNVGYLGAASGVAGIVKTALALHHRRLPPTIGVETLNPAVAQAGLEAQVELGPWPEGGHRLAGVISTSLGGANAFLVLERAAPAPSSHAEPETAWLPFSARTPAGLRRRAEQLSHYLAADEATPLRDVCFTALAGRPHHPHRAVVIADGRARAAELLARFAGDPRHNVLAAEPGAARLLDLAERYVAGEVPEARSVLPPGGRIVSLPPHPFEREVLWPGWLSAARISRPPQGPVRPDAAVEASDDAGRPLLDALHASPREQREEMLVRHLRISVAETLGVDPASVRGERTFFELGMSSLSLSELRHRIEGELGLRLDMPLFFSHPRERDLARTLLQLLEGPAAAKARPEPAPDALKKQRDEPIAVLGMACRFPGWADSPAKLGRLLREGREAIGEIPAERAELQGLYDPDPDRPAKMYMRRGGFLHRVDGFDAEHFGITPREAEEMDPQQRLFLEVSWEALEDAGILADELDGSLTGVFAGAHSKDYAFVGETGPRGVGVRYSTGMDASYLAGRLSYVLGLRGPSMAVDTACSSSLTAVHLACQSLRSGESRLALAGGVKLILSPHISMFLCKSRALSPTGRCRAFDRDADGMVQGEGCGVVVLKRLGQALQDGDRILATIRSTAVNHGGAGGGLTVPNPQAQEDLYRAALERAGVDPRDVDYVEAHGTGTPLGDPVELYGLARVYGAGRSRSAPLYVGSVKTNIGHTEAAAGIAGLIKAVQVARQGEVPPSLGFVNPNPEFDWSEAPLEVADRLIPLPRRDRPRRVAVSSFGMSGVNAHAVLEEHSEPPRTLHRAPHLLVLSERHEGTLATLAAAFAEPLDDALSETELYDLCFTAGERRRHQAWRVAVVGSSAAELREQLRAATPGRAADGAERGPVFVFSGQGPQWQGMGQELLRHEKPFREAAEEVDASFRRAAGWSILERLGSETSSRLADTEIAQPALFLLQVALTRFWRACGVEPAAVVGHSAGEVAAAHVAGALSLDEAARLIHQRGRILQQAAGSGRMLAARIGAGAARELLASAPEVSIAADNGPASCVFSGAGEALDSLAAALGRRGVTTRELPFPYPFHSSLVTPLGAELSAALSGLRPAPSGGIPLISTLEGRAIDGGELDAGYWGRQLGATVRFAPAVAALMAQGASRFLEIGPHPVLGGDLRDLARKHGVRAHVLPSLRRGQPERQLVLSTLAELYRAGAPLRLSALYPGGRPTSLPTKVWRHERFWRSKVAPDEGPAEDARDALSGHYYELRWSEGGSVAPQTAGARWLLVGAPGEGRLEVLRAELGDALALELGADEPLDAALAAAGGDDRDFDGVVYLAPLRQEGVESVSETARGLCARLSALAVELAEWSRVPRLRVVTRGACCAGPASPPPSLEHAALWGLARVIPHELPELGCVRLDLDPYAAPLALSALAAELRGSGGEDEVALRGGRRLVPAFVRVERQAPPRAFAARADRAYLVTGGLGGVGLEVARWLVAHGARHLALASRRGQAEEARETLRALEEQGAVIRLLRCDVSRRDEVAEMLAAIDGEGPPLAGVFHCAGVLDDRPLRRLSSASLARVLAPKVDGAVHLHELLAGAPLDHFVLFSSTASVLGAPGQANYAAANACLDALAHLRRAHRLPGLSVQWGSFAGVGMAAGESGERLAERGMLPMAADEAMPALAQALADEATNRAILRFDPARWARSHPGVASAARLRELLPASAAGPSVDPEAPSLSEALASADPERRRQLLESALRRHVAEVVGLPAERIDPRAAFTEIGIDSLRAHELRHLVSSELDLNVPLDSLLQEGRSIETLAADLAGELALERVILRGEPEEETSEMERLLL